MSLVLMVLVSLWATTPILPCSGTVFVWIVDVICQKMYWSKLHYVFAKCISENCKMGLSKLRNVAGADGLAFPLLWATTPILSVVISALADGSLGYNDHIWWHLSCIFLHYAFVKWKSDTWTKKLIIIANQICINRRVDALCFVNLQNMQNWLKTATFISEPVAVNCLKPMTRGQRSVALY